MSDHSQCQATSPLSMMLRSIFLVVSALIYFKYILKTILLLQAGGYTWESEQSETRERNRRNIRHYPHISMDWFYKHTFQLRTQEKITCSTKHNTDTYTITCLYFHKPSSTLDWYRFLFIVPINCWNQSNEFENMNKKDPFCSLSDEVAVMNPRQHSACI